MYSLCFSQENRAWLNALIIIFLVLPLILPIELADAQVATIKTDKSRYKPGEVLNVSGQSSANDDLLIQVFNPRGLFVAISQVRADGQGNYQSNVMRFPPTNTTSFPFGNYTVKTTSANSGASASTIVIFQPITAAAPPPSVTGVDLASVGQGENIQLTILGRDFAQGAAVSFSPTTGLTVSSTIFVDPGTIRISLSVAPSAPIGPRDVRITNPDGASGTLAAGFSITPDRIAPNWPAGNTLTASSISQTGLTLTWTAAADNVGVTGYRVYQGSTLLATVGGDVLTYTVTGLTSGTQYSFKVEAGDATNNWSTNGPSTTVTTLAPPAFDFAMSAIPVSGTIQQGQTATFAINIALTTGASRPVELDLGGRPPGATTMFSSTSGMPTFISTLTITTSSTTPAGTYRMTVFGYNPSGIGRNTTVTLTVTIPPPAQQPPPAPPQQPVPVPPPVAQQPQEPPPPKEPEQPSAPPIAETSEVQPYLLPIVVVVIVVGAILGLLLYRRRMNRVDWDKVYGAKNEKVQIR